MVQAYLIENDTGVLFIPPARSQDIQKDIGVQKDFRDHRPSIPASLGSALMVSGEGIAEQHARLRISSETW